MDFAKASRLVTSPQATAQDLTDICNAFPELRPSAAIHPNAHPELLNWLARLGDPAVNAALATRASRQQPQQPEPSGGTGWVWTVAALIVAAIAFAVWWFWQSDGDDPGIAPTETTEPAESEEPTDEPTEEPTTDEETTPPETDTETDPDAVGTVAELFPDPAFAACVAEALAVGLEETLTQDKLDGVGTQLVTDLQDYYTEREIEIKLDGSGLACSPGELEHFSFDGIEHLRTLSVLRLHVEDGIDAIDVAPLADLNQLQVFGFSTNDVENDTEIAHIEQLTTLEAAELVRVTPETFGALAELDHLTFLSVLATGLGDAEFLLDMPSLEVLQIGQHSGTLPAEIQTALESKGVRIIEGE